MVDFKMIDDMKE